MEENAYLKEKSVKTQLPEKSVYKIAKRDSNDKPGDGEHTRLIVSSNLVKSPATST